MEYKFVLEVRIRTRLPNIHVSIYPKYLKLLKSLLCHKKIFEEEVRMIRFFGTISWRELELKKNCPLDRKEKKSELAFMRNFLAARQWRQA
jgi:hypothetical protein